MSDLQIYPDPTPTTVSIPKTVTTDNSTPQTQQQSRDQVVQSSQDPPSSSGVFNPLTPPSIVSWSRALSDARNNLTSQLYSDEAFNDQIYNQLFNSNAAAAVALLSIVVQVQDESTILQDISHQEDEYVNTVNNSTNGINNYPFSQDANEVNQMNTYISEYNNGTITKAQYDTYASNYQSYVNGQSSGIAALNALISAYNSNVNGSLATEIADFNARYAAPVGPFPTITGPSDIPNSPAYSLPDAPADSPTPIASLSVPSSISPAVNDISPTIASAESTASAAAVSAFSNSFNLVSANTNQYQQNTDFNAFVQYFFQSKIPALPASYITPAPKPNSVSSAGTGGTGGGVSLGALISSTSSPLTPGILENSMTNAANAQFEQPLAAKTLVNLNLQGASMVAYTGLYAGSTALRLLLGKLSTAPVGESPLSVALGLSFANQISALASSNNPDDQKSINSQVLTTLKDSNPTGNPATLQAHANILTAAIKLSLVQKALSVISQSLNSPTLPAQVVSTLDNAASLQRSLTSVQQTTLGDVLKNQVSVNHIKEDLANQLVSQGIITDQNQARNLVNKSFLDAFNNASAIANQNNASAIANQSTSAPTTTTPTSAQITTTDQLNAALTNSFVQNGINQQNAIALANRAQAYTDAEIQSGNLMNLSINAANINSETLSRDTLHANLTSQNIQADVAKKSLDAIYGEQQVIKDNISQRQLRDNLSSQLAANGNLNPNAALTVATQAVIGSQNPNFTYETASLADLRNNLHTKAVDLITSSLGAEIAKSHTENVRKIAQQIVDTVLGSEKVEKQNKSLRSLLDEQVGTILKTNNQQYADALNDTMRTALKPTLDGYVANQKIMALGSQLVSALYGIMENSHNHQPGRKQNIEFLG